jgi:hypothetical protein
MYMQGVSTQGSLLVKTAVERVQSFGSITACVIFLIGLKQSAAGRACIWSLPTITKA